MNSYSKHLFEKYMAVRDEERMLRRELADAVAQDIDGALKAGLIRFQFAFPVPGPRYRQYINEQLRKRFGIE